MTTFLARFTVVLGAGASGFLGAAFFSPSGFARAGARRAPGLGAGFFALRGSAVASDAFYPFRDGLDEAANAGAKSVIQPGGSIKDDEVIAAANEHGMAMIFTGMRHFRH